METHMTKEDQSLEPAVATDVGSMLGNIFKTDTENGENKLQKGLENLQSLPAFDTPPPPVPGKVFTPGVIGFRKSSGMLHLAIACGTAQVRYISLAKYIALIENLHDPESASIILQNFQDKDEYKSAKGQVTARINALSSAITVIQGVTGRIIRSPQDIALFDVYYIDRKDLTAFYIAAKSQISTADQLETMIATYDGWKAFNVPLNPLNPYEE
jgi:hypothetical protein